MKKIFIILFLLTGVVSFSNAQQGQGGGQRRSPEESAKMQLERLPQTLNLTADQKAKVTAIYLAQAKSRDSLITSMGQGGDREAMRTKMMEMTSATDKQVLVLLNDEQQKAYNEYIKERASRGFGGGGRGQRPPRTN